MVVQESQLSGLRQILIFLDDGVEPVIAGIPVHLRRYDARSPSVACPLIIIHHLLKPRVQLIAHHVQQVMVKDRPVRALRHQRRVVPVLHPGQLLAEVRCQPGRLHVQPQAVVVAADTPQHRLPHRPQHLVIGPFPLFPHLPYSRRQRVRSNRCHHLCTLKPRLEQLSVVTMLGRLTDNLLQQFILCLGQVFLPCRFHFLPKRSIRISKHQYWHYQCN